MMDNQKKWLLQKPEFGGGWGGLSKILPNNNLRDGNRNPVLGFLFLKHSLNVELFMPM